MAVPPAPFRIPSQRPLALSVASVMSVTNDNDNEMILEAVHRYPSIYLTAEENSRKPEGAVRPIITSNGVSDEGAVRPQMGSLSSK